MSRRISLSYFLRISVWCAGLLFCTVGSAYAQVHTTPAKPATTHTTTPPPAKPKAVAPADTAKVAPGVITVKEDTGIDYIMRNFVMPNDLKKTTRGYRIQLISTTNRQLAYDTKSKFMTQFPDVRVYVIYQQPYFKVRAGDFETETEVQALYKRVRKLYNASFPVNDNVNINR